jgi:hypothetical protein
MTPSWQLYAGHESLLALAPQVFKMTSRLWTFLCSSRYTTMCTGIYHLHSDVHLVKGYFVSLSIRATSLWPNLL